MSNNYYFSPIPEVEELFAERAILILGENWKKQVQQQADNGFSYRREGSLTNGSWKMMWDLDAGKVAYDSKITVTCCEKLEDPAKEIPAYLLLYKAARSRVGDSIQRAKKTTLIQQPPRMKDIIKVAWSNIAAFMSLDTQETQPKHTTPYRIL